MRFLKHLETFRDNLSINNFSERTIEKYYSANKAFLNFINISLYLISPFPLFRHFNIFGKIK